MIIHNVMNEYVLLDGTDQKFAFQFPANIPIGQAGVKLHDALKRLHAKMAEHPGTMGYCGLVDAAMLGWVYTSVEATNLRAENEELRKRVGALEHKLAGVEQSITNLTANLAARMGLR